MEVFSGSAGVRTGACSCRRSLVVPLGAAQVRICGSENGRAPRRRHGQAHRPGNRRARGALHRVVAMRPKSVQAAVHERAPREGASA
eukprot:7193950-Pyramimonas_sp.AAC.1